MEHTLSKIGGVFFLATLVYAPWALACQPPWAMHVMEGGMAISILFWIAGSIAAAQPPRIPIPLMFVSVLIAVLGWLRVLTNDGSSHPIQLRAALAAAQNDEMVLVSILLGASCFVADLVRFPQWRQWIWLTICAGGASISIAGLAQHLGIADPFAKYMQVNEGYHFGPFNYHATAGAYLNMVMPLCVGWAAWTYRQHGPGWRFAGAVALVVVVAAGIAANVSRAAQVVALVEGVCLAIILTADARARQSRKGLPDRLKNEKSRPTALLIWGAIAALMLSFVAITIAVAGPSARRWQSISDSLRLDSARPLLWQVCAQMARDAGMWGDGPGTFKVLLADAPNVKSLLFKWIVIDYQPNQPVSIWNHAHNDVLQTLIEWGWLGTLVWAVLLLGGWTVVMQQFSRKLGRDDRFDVILAGCIGTAMAGLFLHSLVDFPFQVEALRLYITVLVAMAWSSPLWFYPQSQSQLSTDFDQWEMAVFDSLLG